MRGREMEQCPERERVSEGLSTSLIKEWGHAPGNGSFLSRHG